MRKLEGDRKDQYSIRVNDHTEAYEVEVTDYHLDRDVESKKLAPIHPGETLKSVLHDAHLSANAAALALRVPQNRLTEILQGRRAISADTAMRLARYFGTSAQMWMNLQTKYDLDVAGDELAERIRKEIAPLQKSA